MKKRLFVSLIASAIFGSSSMALDLSNFAYAIFAGGESHVALTQYACKQNSNRDSCNVKIRCGRYVIWPNHLQLQLFKRSVQLGVPIKIVRSRSDRTLLCKLR